VRRQRLSAGSIQDNEHIEIPSVDANTAVAVDDGHRVEVGVLELIAYLFAVAASCVDLDLCVLWPRHWQGCGFGRRHGLKVAVG
jgi:hypothetical protein